MGYIIDGYKKMYQEGKAYAIQHRAGIGTAISIGGTVASNILSTRAGARSARMIDAREMELGRTLTNKEKLKLCWKNHIASATTAAVSCVGAGYSHNEHVKDFNKVATAYAGVKKLYDSTRKATREVLGEKKSMELQDKLNQKYIEEHPEIKREIVRQGINPEPGVKQKYWEPITGITFYCTKDKIESTLETMRANMMALNPRTAGMASRSGDYGIHLYEFFDRVYPDLPEEKRHAACMGYGWPKGIAVNGSDDGEIDVYYTPMLIDNEQEAVIAINWEEDPSDMRYGDYLKL